MDKIFQEIKDAIQTGYTFEQFATSQEIGIVPTDYPRFKPVDAPKENIAIFKKSGFIDKTVVIGDAPQDEIKAYIKRCII